jgi:ABC-2 type transport system permease protein
LAVYVSQTLKNGNFCCGEGFALILLPESSGWYGFLAINLPKSNTLHRCQRNGLKFMIALRRDGADVAHKSLPVVAAVFGLFGMFAGMAMPQMFKAIPGAEQFANLIPKPTVVDALTQYKRILPKRFILAIFLGMGAVAGEKERGTASLVLSKPMTRWAFVSSKFTAQVLVYLVGFGLALLGAYFYIVVLFGAYNFGTLAFVTFLMLAWLLPFIALTLDSSVIGGSTSAAAGIAPLAVSVVGRQYPHGGLFRLTGWPATGRTAEVTANGGAGAAWC